MIVVGRTVIFKVICDKIMKWLEEKNRDAGVYYSAKFSSETDAFFPGTLTVPWFQDKAVCSLRKP